MNSQEPAPGWCHPGSATRGSQQSHERCCHPHATDEGTEDREAEVTEVPTPEVQILCL